MSDHQPRPKVSATPILVGALFSAVLLAGCFDSSDGVGSPIEAEALSSATFTSIGFLPGNLSSQAIAISADGLVVVGSSIAPGGGKMVPGKSQAFRWSAREGMVSLGLLPGGTSSNARAVSADGAVVVGDGDAPSISGAVFRWSASSGLELLTPLADSNICVASGVSGDGNVVVGTCRTDGNSAYRWSESTGMVSLGQFGDGSNRTSNAVAISANGAAIVGMGHPTLTGAVLWSSAGDASILGWLPGDVSATATAVSRDGSVVVGYSSEPSLHLRAFRWTRQAGMTAISASTEALSDVIASAVAGDGEVIVGWGITPDREVATIWDERHGMRQLEDVLKLDYQTTLAGWKLERANGISDDGRTIVGFGTNPSGQREGWVVKLQNPSSITAISESQPLPAAIRLANLRAAQGPKRLGNQRRYSTGATVMPQT